MCKMFTLKVSNIIKKNKRAWLFGQIYSILISEDSDLNMVLLNSF